VWSKDAARSSFSDWHQFSAQFSAWFAQL